jgi:hypothetical protein
MRDGVVAGTLSPLEPYTSGVVFEMAAGNTARSLEILDEARAALATNTDPCTEAYFLGFMASFESMAGRIEQARADSERALELARAIGSTYLIAMAYHGAAWAYQRDDPAAALAASEEYLYLYREFGVDPRLAASALVLAGGMRARLRDNAGALEILHQVVVLTRDQGIRPQLGAALDWALSPLLRTRRPDVAANLLGALTTGALAEGTSFPGVHAARALAHERVRSTLGDAKTNELVSRGAAMTYDELVEYALHHLNPD